MLSIDKYTRFGEIREVNNGKKLLNFVIYDSGLTTRIEIAYQDLSINQGKLSIGNVIDNVLFARKSPLVVVSLDDCLYYPYEVELNYDCDDNTLDRAELIFKGYMETLESIGMTDLELSMYLEWWFVEQLDAMTIERRDDWPQAK